MKKFILVAMILCMGVVLAACGGSSDQGTASEASGAATEAAQAVEKPEGLSDEVHEFALELIEINDQYDAGELSKEEAYSKAEALLDKLGDAVVTDLDQELHGYLQTLKTKLMETSMDLAEETADAYNDMYQRQIERAKDVLGIEY